MAQWRITDFLSKDGVENAVLFLKRFPINKEPGWVDHSSDEPFPFLFACIVFSVVIYLIEQYLNLRQLINFKNEEGDLKTPKGVSDEVFQKSLLYGADKLGFEMKEMTFSLVYGIAILCLGGLPFVWSQAGIICRYLGVLSADSSAIWSECVQTSVFVFLFSIHDTIQGLPWSLYSTFVIEQKHGFNKQTLGLFMKDKIISLVLVFIIGSPVISGIVWLARTCGDNFPLYVWAFLMVVSLIMMVIYPIWIAPLFNEYKELEDGQLKDAIYSLAKSVEFPLKKLYTMDGSKRSSHSNAFFYGFGKSKMIVLFDTLLTQVSQGELLAILGHEIGHWRLWHTIQGFVISQLYTLCLFYAFSYSMNTPSLFSAFGFTYNGTSTPVFVGLMLFMTTYWSPVEKVLAFLLNMNSRYNEFAADKYSQQLGMGKDLSSGLIKISVENLGNMCPDSWYSAYHFSHPPVVERIAAIADADKRDAKKGK